MFTVWRAVSLPALVDIMPLDRTEASDGILKKCSRIWAEKNTVRPATQFVTNLRS